MAKTRAQKNREIRRDSEREHLKTLGLIQYVIELADKLAKPQGLTSTEVTALKNSADIRLKLIDKFLPSLQSIEQKTEITERYAIAAEPMDSESFEDKYNLGAAERSSESIN